MSTSVFVVCDVHRPPVKLVPSEHSSPSSQRHRLQARIPAIDLKHGQLFAFIHAQSENNNNNSSSVENRNAAEAYYEATLTLKSGSGNESGSGNVIGKLSKTTRCIHWEGNLVKEGDAFVTVEADWQEYRIHVRNEPASKLIDL